MVDSAGAPEIASLVRAHDRPRYFATLFAPPELRPDLLALYGFAAEIARIPDLVSEPGLGEIRLQWWREALEMLGEDKPAPGVPLLTALDAARQHHALPLAPLMALVEARRADLYSDPQPTIVDLEGYLGETESVLFQLAAIICGSTGPETAEAAGHAGIAYSLSRRLANFAADRVRGRTILPAELLQRLGLRFDKFLAADVDPRLAEALGALLPIATGHLEETVDALETTPPAVRPAFQAMAVVRPLLKRLTSNLSDVARRPVNLSDLSMLTRIGWANLSGRFG